MGVDAADLDGDGWQDLLVANIDHEMFSLYRNSRAASSPMSRGSTAWPRRRGCSSGWGLKFFDFDNDGDVDLLLANGHPDDTIALRAPEVKYQEPLLLFRHDGRRLRNISQQAGPVFSKAFPARGLAVGDFNNDGRVDVLVGCNGEAPVLLRNNAGPTTTGSAEAAGRDLQSRRGRRAHHLVGRRHRAIQTEDQRRELSVVARSARGARPGPSGASSIGWKSSGRCPAEKPNAFTGVPVDRYVTIVEGRGKVG